MSVLDSLAGRQMRATVAAALLFALLGVGAVQPAAAQHKTYTVVIEAMKFTPEVLEVAAGDTVVWQNKDAFPHNATAPAGGLKSPDIASNRSWKFKARKKGEFPYVCTLHPGMKATLIVK
jgi:plastocyanin